MCFEHFVKFYKLNDDSTITFYVDDKYFRCKAKMDILLKFVNMEKDVLLLCKFGLAYVRGQGLVLQLIDFSFEK